MRHQLKIKNEIPIKKLEDMLRKIKFRGLYNSKGGSLYPYKNAKFSITTVYPQKGMNIPPHVKIGKKRETLFSPQPTIYQNQTEIMQTIDSFLKKHNTRINTLKKAIEFEWEDRGCFHVLPPIIEKHSYDLKNGFLDLSKMGKRFNKTYVKDARGNLHNMSNRYLKSFYIDDISKIEHLDVFHSNAPLINYGLQYNGILDFYIVCDGMHRIDYSIEVLGEPINSILVEPDKPKDLLIPYYAFPVPFRPTIRLSSKRSEKMYSRLERDKIHLFNDFIKKVLHYDWSCGGLNVSSLRSKPIIY